MKKDGKGGANTKTGLVFEGKVNICNLLENIDGYSVRKNDSLSNPRVFAHDIFYNDELVAQSFPKQTFYNFLKSKGVDYTNIISARLEPDDALFVIPKKCSLFKRKKIFIIEYKSQGGGGSTDEKLQTCDFKLKQYSKLVKKLKYNVEYVYVLHDWFDNPRYKDVFEYIESVGCHYYFNEIPLKLLGLPEGK